MRESEMEYTEKQLKFLSAAIVKYGEGAIMSKESITEIAEEIGMKFPFWLTDTRRMGSFTKVDKDTYRLPAINGGEGASVADVVVSTPAVVDKVVVESKNTESTFDMSTYFNPAELIPKKDPLFVAHGHFSDLIKVLNSKKFYPVFETGESGTGKTYMTEQACAKLKKEFIRVNITVETDEDDLLGHYALIDGNTVWQDGPVVIAMERGAVLLLDEIDLASNKVMCLQPILEGKGVYLKKINRMVTPTAGFTVIATANTKGKGSEDGRFVFTNILNEAFLERFPITMEVGYPSASTEKKIVNKVLDSLGVSDSDFAEKLVNWANAIRKTFYDGGIDEVIATRRLVHISNAFAIFGDRMKSIEMCVNRFDEDTKTSFLDLYSKIDAEAVIPSDETEAEEAHRMLDEESVDSGYSSENDENNPF
jgi:MoxR-like ATPase